MMDFQSDLLDFTGFCFQKKIMPTRSEFENWFRRAYHQKSDTASEEGIQTLLFMAQHLMHSIESVTDETEIDLDPKSLHHSLV